MAISSEFTLRPQQFATQDKVSRPDVRVRRSAGGLRIEPQGLRIESEGPRPERQGLGTESGGLRILQSWKLVLVQFISQDRTDSEMSQNCL